MGHVFSYTQADFVARFQRMSGKDVFYPMGFDDNGLPTERLVEKIIEKKAGVYESENGHGSFVKKCREVVEMSEKEFEILFNSIALSVDWDQKYQTISPDSQKISQETNTCEDLCEPFFSHEVPRELRGLLGTRASVQTHPLGAPVWTCTRWRQRTRQSWRRIAARRPKEPPARRKTS